MNSWTAKIHWEDETETIIGEDFPTREEAKRAVHSYFSIHEMQPEPFTVTPTQNEELKPETWYEIKGGMIVKAEEIYENKIITQTGLTCSKEHIIAEVNYTKPSETTKAIVRKAKNNPQLSYLIVECNEHNEIYIYHEELDHHNQVEPDRQKHLRRLNWETIADECRVNPGEYMAIPILEI